MKVVITFLENVLQPEMEEEFVKLTEVVLKFELKKVFNFKQLSFFGSCFFWSYLLRQFGTARLLLFITILYAEPRHRRILTTIRARN